MEPKRFRLIQDGQVVASAEGDNALAEIRHYALIYSQDGPVTIQKRHNRRWHDWSEDQ
jgi:hypothetical protein